ncbi:MAG: GNAT family N-acetyltransferase [Muribaculaceae bacterium]|nr:GNAT family N-acetyltransferase [Muribaculaceae bacterium]
MIIERYTPAMKPAWDAFAMESRNATFLHRRGYMDYHADRFRDHSLVARATAGGRIVALLPANAESDGTLASHRGLTYGGWLTPPRHFSTETMLELFDALTDHMRAEGLRRLVYRPVPHIYHRYPAEDDVYALWRLGARMDACGASATVALRRAPLLDRGSKSAVSAVRRAGVSLGPSHDFEAFWAILEEVLASRHETRPVHTLAEMRMLRDRFPDNIRLYAAVADGRMEAGVVVYRCGTVAHAQYIAASPRARTMRLLPALYSHIMDCECEGMEWFDFGISTEQGGRVLNAALDSHKSRLGGRCTLYQSFVLEL